MRQLQLRPPRSDEPVVFMCVDASPKAKCGGQSNCGCGGHGRAKPVALNPRTIRTIKFGEQPGHPCGGSAGGRCPRHYLAPTGCVLGGFLILHLAVNALALWPGRFQTTVNRFHSFGMLLTALEIGLATVLIIHIGAGLRLMRRDKLKFTADGHFHGSPMRQWLQRVTAVIMLAFLSFHLAVLHRWFGGRFDPNHAFNSASQAIWQFWKGWPAGSFPNLLFAQFYLLGIAAAVYHLTNGVATGAEFLGLVSTPAAQERLWRVCLMAAPVLLLAGLAAWYGFAVR